MQDSDSETDEEREQRVKNLRVSDTDAAGARTVRSDRRLWSCKVTLSH